MSRSRSPTKVRDHKKGVSTLKFIIEEKLPAKTMPPFRRIPYYNVCALILSFYGYRRDVKELLKNLNCNSRKYFLSHKEILRAFVPVYVKPPPINFEKVMVFGGVSQSNQKWGCNVEWYPPGLDTKVYL